LLFGLYALFSFPKRNRILKNLALIIAVLLLLAFILDPFVPYIRNSTAHFTHEIFGSVDDGTNDDTDSLNNAIPDSPDFDSTGILQGIDSIESAPKGQEIITK
jgi:predicted PurR-regulated permease PerM